MSPTIEAGPREDRLENRLARAEARLADLEKMVPDELTTFLVLSADLEPALPALMVAHASAAMGNKVRVYFAFWGVLVVRQRVQFSGKSWLDKCLTAMLPGDYRRLPLSRMQWGGVGARVMSWLMRRRKMPSPQELVDMASDAGVDLVVCPQSIETLGLSRAELLPGVRVGGAASFIQDASVSNAALVF